MSHLIPSTRCEGFTSSYHLVSQLHQGLLEEDTHTHSCYVVLLSLDPEFLGALTTQH